MSEISATSAAGAGGLTSAASARIDTSGVSGGSEGTSVSQTSQSLNISSSSTSYYSGISGTDDKLGTMVMALIDIILGLNDDDDKDKKLLGGIVGLLALAGANRMMGNELRSLEFSQSSQVMQMTTTTNVSAVQASAYDQAAGGADAGAAGQVGGNLDVSA